MTDDGGRGAILAIDTATTRAVIAIGSTDGAVDGVTSWEAGHRHGETLLPAIEAFLHDRDLPRSRLTGIVVGTGPGAFTGLRVGIATAKGIAHGLGIPLVGASTGEALLVACGIEPAVLLLPAGPSDRVEVRAGEAPRLLPGGTDPDLQPGEVLVAVDLPGRAPDDAIARGALARDGLGAALLAAGAAALLDAAGTSGGLATVVPEYVTLPRGVHAVTGTVAWSRDPR